MPENTPTSLNCPACGAPLDYDGRSSIVKCKFCGNVSVVPGNLQAQPGLAGAGLDQVRQLIHDENILNAIQKYRELFGSSLKEARDAVEALRQGHLVEQSEMPFITESPDKYRQVLEEVQQLVKAGNKLEAIKRYREVYDVSLARAKYAVEQIETGNTLWPEAGFPQQVFVPPTPTVKTGKAVGAVVGLSIMLFIGGLLAFFMFLPGGPLVPHLIANGDDILIPAAQGGALDIAGLFYDPDKSTYQVALIDGSSGRNKWVADPLPSGDYPDGIIAGDTLVYAASDINLLAYSLADGSLAWQARMPDTLGYGENILLVTRGRVITVNVDQSIQAYDATNGNLVWSRRLAGYDRNLRLMGGLLGVVDYAPDSTTYNLYLLNPVDGSEQRVLSPSCQTDTYSSDDLEPDSGILFSDAENAFYFFYNSYPGCIQKADFTTGQVIWQTVSQENYSFSFNGFSALVSDQVIFFDDGSNLLSVSRADGTEKVVLSNTDYDFVPLALSGDTLLVRAKRTRGTQRFELWALNLGSGSTAWQKDLQGAEPIDPPDAMSGLVDDSDYGWTWKVTSSGLKLLTFQGGPNQLVIDTLNMADGSLADEKTLPLKEVYGDFYSVPSVIGWQGDVVYLNVDTTLYAINAQSAEKIFSH